MVASLPKKSMAVAALLGLSQSVTAQSPQYTTVVVPEVTVYCPYVQPTDSMGHTIPICPGDETTVTTGSYTVTDVLVTGIETLGYVGFPGGSQSAVTSFATFYSLIGTRPGVGGSSSSSSDYSSSYTSSDSASSTDSASTSATDSATPSEPTSTAVPSETTPASSPTVSSAPVSTATVVVGSNPSGTAEPGSVTVVPASSPAAPISTGAAADVKVPHVAFAAVAGVAGVVAAIM